MVYAALMGCLFPDLEQTVTVWFSVILTEKIFLGKYRDQVKFDFFKPLALNKVDHRFIKKKKKRKKCKTKQPNKRNHQKPHNSITHPAPSTLSLTHLKCKRLK